MYSEPKVTIDLAEYNELKKDKEISYNSIVLKMEKVLGEFLRGNRFGTINNPIDHLNHLLSLHGLEYEALRRADNIFEIKLKEVK